MHKYGTSKALLLAYCTACLAAGAGILAVGLGVMP